eukprot:Selendium_serpulae@DN5973_c0_g1_i12.p1
MSRHSKNNTAHSIFTYHERKMMKDVGTLKQRLSGDSLRKFEQCWLCLRTARNPVATPKGYIYCKECIILNFARQKDEATRGLAAWMNSEAEKEKMGVFSLSKTDHTSGVCGGEVQRPPLLQDRLFRRAGRGRRRFLRRKSRRWRRGHRGANIGRHWVRRPQ